MGLSLTRQEEKDAILADKTHEQQYLLEEISQLKTSLVNRGAEIQAQYQKREDSLRRQLENARDRVLEVSKQTKASLPLAPSLRSEKKRTDATSFYRQLTEVIRGLNVEQIRLKKIEAEAVKLREEVRLMTSTL